MTCTATTLKLKMRWFPDEASCWAEKLYTDIDLAPFVPDEDKNFGVSLVLDFKTMMMSHGSQEFFTGLVKWNKWKMFFSLTAGA